MSRNPSGSRARVVTLVEMRRALLFALVCLCLAPSAWAATPNDQAWSMQWNMRIMRADRAWATSKGSGVVVAVVDTGVDLNHPDLQGRLVSGVDLVAPGTPPQDENGHGTHMSGVIAATTGNTIGVASVAPSAKIMPIRVLESNGSGRSDTVAEGIRYATSHGARIINLSLAQDDDDGGQVLPNLFASPSINDAIEDAARAGVFVAAAAGNNGASKTAYDASTPGVLVVGASTSRDQRAAYSNYGSGLDILAPGGAGITARDCDASEEIVSTWWTASGGSQYGKGCGTSMSVAHVSGLAALLLARGYNSRAAAERIIATAVDLESPGRDNSTGYGRVDALAAVGSTSAPPPAAAPKPKPKSTSPGAVGAAGSPTSAPQPPPPAPVASEAPTASAAPAPLALGPGPMPPPPDARGPLTGVAGGLLAIVGLSNAAVLRSMRSRRGGDLGLP